MTALRAVPRDVAVLVAILAVALLVRLPSLGQPLVEQHGFRQTWTAWTAELFHERGIDLFRPLIPIFGPPFVVPSELPLFQVLGALVMALGLPTDPAMRVACLVTFVGCAVAVWLLARDLADRAIALVAVALFVATPLALLWSRTAMIEYLALGSAVASCWAGLRWRDGRGAWWWPVALAFGAVAALVKPPTFVAWAIPLLVARDRVEAATPGAWLRTRLDPRLVALAVVPVVAAYAWLAYGDAVKASQPAAAFLQSTAPFWRSYYYGTLADRIDPGYLERVADSVSALAIGRYAVAFAAVGLAVAVRGRRASAWWGIALAAILPILVFWGAYRQHDYYFVAITAQTALVGAAGVVWSWRAMRGRAARAGVAVLAVATVAGSLAYDSGYWTRMYEPVHDTQGVLPAARRLASATSPDELVAVLGYGYDPSRLYYARRHGYMLTTENFADALGGLPRGAVRTLYVADPWADALFIARRWHWVGAREAGIYRVSDERSGVADAPLVSTDQPVTLPVPARALGATPLTIPCDFAGADVPAGRAGTLLRLAPGYGAGARLAVGHYTGPVPARTWVWLDGALTANVDRVRVTCAGAPALTVLDLFDAALTAP